MNEELKSNLLSKKHWSRLVFMLLISIVLYVAFFITWFVIIAQFVFALITGNDNNNLRRLGSSLALFIRQCVSFLTYSADVKPFPFSDWPQAEDVDIHVASANTADQNMDAEVHASEVQVAEVKIEARTDCVEKQAQDTVADTSEAPSIVSIDKDDNDKKEI